MEEFAKRLKIVLYTLIISTITVMVLPANLSFINDPLSNYEPLIAAILRIIREDVLPASVRLIGLEFVAPLELYLIASFFFGAAATAPVLAYEIFKFIDPALYPHERRDIYPSMTFFIVLFVSGLIFGYLVLVPYGLAALLPFFQMAGAEPYISVSNFYFFVFFLTLMTGVVFTLPVFLVLFVKYGIIETKMLTKNRRYVYVGLMIVVFLITPGEGGLANLMLFTVMAVLFEVGVFLAKSYEKREKIRHPLWRAEESKCRFCGKSVSMNTTFCPSCGKSQR
ncbi:twin-arginine translocase subunit TatC [Candidatus Bathyarchaeota archaeon]|nr:twin-arginine translocase subunit TatC [Candidatus Bathyarchaeota archaeon]